MFVHDICVVQAWHGGLFRRCGLTAFPLPCLLVVRWITLVSGGNMLFPHLPDGLPAGFAGVWSQSTEGSWKLVAACCPHFMVHLYTHISALVVHGASVDADRAGGGGCIHDHHVPQVGCCLEHATMLLRCRDSLVQDQIISLQWPFSQGLPFSAD